MGAPRARMLSQPGLELLPPDSRSSQSRKAGTMGSLRQRGAWFRRQGGAGCGSLGRRTLHRPARLTLDARTRVKRLSWVLSWNPHLIPILAPF